MNISEAEEILRGVTPGPWVAYGEPEVGLPSSLFSGKIGEFGFGPIEPLQGADLHFVAWCREGVPALLARIAAQEAQIKGLEHDRDEWRQRAIDRCEASEKWLRKYGVEKARAEAAETALAAERAKVAKLVEAGKRAADLMERHNLSGGLVSDLHAAITEAGHD